MAGKEPLKELLLTLPPKMNEEVRLAAFNERIPKTVWIRRAVAEALDRLKAKEAQA